MEILDQKMGAPMADNVCQWIGKNKLSYEQQSVQTVFYRSEAQRLFQCSDKDDSLQNDVQRVVTNTDTNTLSNNDLYYSSLVNQKAKDSKFEKAIQEFVTSKRFMDTFKEDKIAVSGGDGVTIESLQALELLVNHLEDKSAGEAITKKVKKALTKLFKDAGNVYDDEGQDNQFFFVATKNAF